MVKISSLARPKPKRNLKTILKHSKFNTVLRSQGSAVAPLLASLLGSAWLPRSVDLTARLAWLSPRCSVRPVCPSLGLAASLLPAFQASSTATGLGPLLFLPQQQRSDQRCTPPQLPCGGKYAPRPPAALPPRRASSHPMAVVEICNVRPKTHASHNIYGLEV